MSALRQMYERVPLSGWLALLLAALIVPLVAYLYRGTFFIWTVPPLAVAAAGIAAMAAGARRLPVAASAFLLIGATSLIWSLAPGHTLINIVWESIYLGAFAASTWMPAFITLNLVLLYFGLEQTLLLDAFGLTQYFSGSIHYLAGAQGLLFLPICLALAARASTQYRRALFLLAGGLSLFLVLNSGARAVYLPLIVLLPFLGWRLVRSTRSIALLATLCVPLLVALGLNYALPGSSLERAIGIRTAATLSTVLGSQTASAGATNGVATVAEEDGIRSRLNMWDQSARIGLQRPLGTGAGTFREVVHAFQVHASVGFSSAHNVFLEVFASGGWLRLGLLLALLLPALYLGWSDDRWPYALGAAGLWMTMSFDITAQIPSIMAVAFASLGPLCVVSQPEGRTLRWTKRGFAAFALAVSLAAAAWWYWPCQGLECAVGRHLGFRPEVRMEMRGLELEERRSLAEDAVSLNPYSLWAWQELLVATPDTVEKLQLAEDLAQRFPRASSQVYLQWAELALVLDQPAEAQRAIRSGLENFPPELRPAGVPLASRGEQHGRWLERAQEILVEVKDYQ